MRRIDSQIDVNSDTYASNRAYQLSLVGELKEKLHAARHVRPQRDMDRLARQSKLYVRDRLELLLDPGSPFLELSALAANQEYDGEVPSACTISGIGLVSGREVYIHADDASIKGGAWYPLTVKKMNRGLDIAIENRLPVIHLCDSAGGFLPLWAGLFPDARHGGRYFNSQCTLSQLGVPQISVVLGHCTAGGAYVPALSDYAIIKRGTGGIFLGGPPLVKAATGEEVSAEDLGGVDVHTRVSGTADYPAETEEEAIALAREIVATNLAPAEKEEIDWAEPEEPYYDTEELYGVIPPSDRIQYDVREIIARLVDGSRFHEFQPNYGTTLVCGFARLWGYKVGILGNNGVLFNDSSLKAAHFIDHCNKSKTPLIFLQNITGFMVGSEYEARGIAKDGAKMIMMQSNVRVPKFTVIVGGSYGAGNYGMCGRAFDPRFLFTWPTARVCLMGAEQAAGVLTDLRVAQMKRAGENPSDEEIAEIRDPIFQRYEADSSPYYATSEVWDDGMIDPADTRNALGLAISASLNAPMAEPRNGILRL